MVSSGRGERESEERRERRRGTHRLTNRRLWPEKADGAEEIGGCTTATPHDARVVESEQKCGLSSAVVCPRPATETDPLKPPYEGSGEA